MISETWKPVFGQDHAQLKCQAPILISLEPIRLLEFKEAAVRAASVTLTLFQG
jgi:hypothetical protein